MSSARSGSWGTGRSRGIRSRSEAKTIEPSKARQGRAEAEMDAVAEREVAFVGAIEVEGIGRCEVLRIAVRGIEHLEHHVARPEPLTTQQRLLLDAPRLAGHGTLVVGPRWSSGRHPGK